MKEYTFILIQLLMIWVFISVSSIQTEQLASKINSCECNKQTPEIIKEAVNESVCQKALERSVLYNTSILGLASTHGVYTHNWGYSVWTKNRTNPNINRTEYHESCHDFVYNDLEHFCGELKLKNSTKNKKES